jgi:hypothetical protein
MKNKGKEVQELLIRMKDVIDQYNKKKVCNFSSCRPLY